jgi:hypothetical protein
MRQAALMPPRKRSNFIDAALRETLRQLDYLLSLASEIGDFLRRPKYFYWLTCVKNAMVIQFSCCLQYTEWQMLLTLALL